MHFLANCEKGFILLGIYLLTGLPCKAFIGKYPIKNFSPSEYKAGIQNIDFAQNRDMNLFVANNLGVLSFNGIQWEVHAHNTGKKQRSLAFDVDSERLYVGSQGEFGFFKENWEYASLIDKIPADKRGFDEVWETFIHKSKVYFCTFQGIYEFDGHHISVIQRNGGFNRSFYSGNRLYSQSPDGELFEIDGTQITDKLLQLQKNQIVSGVLPWEDGQLIFYNSGHIELSKKYEVSVIFPDLVRQLKGKFVNHVMLLSDTRFVISTQRAGLYFYDPRSNQIENITIKDGLQTNACLRTFQDFSGNLWVGMQNGIALVHINSPLKLLNQDIGLHGSGYEAYETNEGTYYTTSNGIYFLSKSATQTIFLGGTEGPAYGTQMINNKLYAGHHTGLFLLENGKAKRIAYTNGLWTIKRLKFNPNYALGGTYTGLHLFKLNNAEVLEEVQIIDGFHESSRFFEEDQKGNIWVCQYYKGLYQIELDQSLSKAIIHKNSSTFDLNIRDHMVLSSVNEELYLGTDNGIFQIDQENNMIIPDKLFANKVGNDWVYLIVQDNQQNVHIYTEKNVGFFKRVSANNYAFVPSSLFQLRQSFNNDLLNVSTNISKGVLFNANEGFIHYDPDFEQRLQAKKPPLVAKIYSLAEDRLLYARLPFQSRTDSIEAIRIIQGTKLLKFEVESFQFKDVNNRQFRYYLKGFDNDFSEWSNVTFKEYTNLSEGSYEFFVQTANYLGETVTGKSIMIVVDPPLYKRFVAKLIYGILLITLLILIYRFQKQHYKEKQHRIEQTKYQELAEKQNELKKMKEEQIESELRHVNNLLASSTMNLVVKNEFMENIKEEIKQVKLKGQSKDAQGALERIIKEIDSTLKVQEDWKQFEYHFDRVHGDFLDRLTSEFLDLTPGEQKLCAFLRLKMDTKEIANLMGISLRGVEVARYRLRKKLGLDKLQNLSKFILEY